MSNQASFAVKLIDRVTRPARAMVKALERIEKPLKRIQKSKAFVLLNKAADKIIGWGKAAAVGIGVAGVAIGAVTTAMVANMGRFAESSRLAFQYLYRGTGQSGQAFATSIRLAGELGQDVEDVTGQFIKLRAMQFSLGESEQVFKLAADLKALTGDANAAGRAVMAITQIKAKGRLQSEELVGQLAENGVSTVLVYEALSKRLGKTTDQVRKLITAGKVSAEVGIEAIKEAVKAKLHEPELGAFASERARTTLGGALDRLSAAPKLFFLRVAREAQPAMDRIRRSVLEILKSIQGLDARSFADFVSRVVALLPGAIELAKEFAVGFGEGFREVLDGIGGLSGIATDQRALWRDFGRGVAKGFALALEALQGIAKLVAWLQTPAGKVVAGVAASTLILTKLIAVGPAVVAAFGPVVTISQAIISGIAAALPVIGTVLGGVVAQVVGAVGAAIAAIVGLPVGAVAAIAVGLVAAGVAIYHWWDDIMAFFARAASWLTDAGGRMIEGLVNGLVAGWQRVRSAVAGIADGLVATVQDALGIASPSRVMRELGQQTAAGFELGLSEGGASAFGGRAAAGAGAAAVAPGAGSRVVRVAVGPISITIGASNASPRQLRDAVSSGVAGGIRKALHESGEFAGA